MKIILVRHGESMANVWGDAYDDDGTNFLTKRGALQAELAGYTVNDLVEQVDMVTTSSLTRARQTATTIMHVMDDWKRIYNTDDRLNEWCWMSKEKEKWYEAESSEQFWKRLESYYDEYIGDMWDEDVNLLIVSHYYTMVGLTEFIKQGCGAENTVGDKLDPANHGHIPNAVPFVFDTTLNQKEPMMVPAGWAAKNR